MSTCTSMFDVKIHDSFSLTNSPCLALRNFIDSFRCEDPNIEIPSLGAAAARHICGLSTLTQNEQGCSSPLSIHPSIQVCGFHKTHPIFPAVFGGKHVYGVPSFVSKSKMQITHKSLQIIQVTWWIKTIPIQLSLCSSHAVMGATYRRRLGVARPPLSLRIVGTLWATRGSGS